jgi:hypothetical protein
LLKYGVASYYVCTYIIRETGLLKFIQIPQGVLIFIKFPDETMARAQ